MKYQRKTIGTKALQNLMVEYIVRNRPLDDLRKRIVAPPPEAEWDDVVRKAEKQAKSRRMAEVSIEHLVKARLHGTGLLYRLEPQKLRMTVHIRLSGGQKMMIALSHKRFLEQIDGVVSAAQMIDKVMREAGQPIHMRSVHSYEQWTNPDA